MLLHLLKSKLHCAVVTEADPDYEGSIAIARDLMEAAGLLPGEKVLVANVENAHRFETYVIPAPAGSGTIGLNGAAALLGSPGDRVIIMAWGIFSEEEARTHAPTVVRLTRENGVEARFPMPR